MKNEVDRFTLEENIMTCWGVTEDIDLIIGAVNDMEIAPSDADDLVNTLIGLRGLSELRFKKLFDTLSHLIESGQFK